MKTSDIIVGIFLVLLGFHVYHVSSKFEVMKKVTFGGPEFFPRFVTAFLMICSVLLIVNAFRGKALNKRIKVTSQDVFWIFCVFLLTVGFVISINFLGFLTSTLIYLLIFLIILKERRPLLIVATSLLAPLVIFLFFVKLMGIPLPEGLLF